jgi:hypothetical protein
MVGLLILPLLDPGQHLAETLVLDDGRVADALQLVEDRVRQRQSLPGDRRPKLEADEEGVKSRAASHLRYDADRQSVRQSPPHPAPNPMTSVGAACWSTTKCTVVRCG